MRPDTATPVAAASEPSGQSDRRHGSRTPTLFSLLYSCINSGQMLIGDGAVTDLSSRGIGIRGNQSVTPRMEVTLFHRPSWNGRAVLHYPEPNLLGSRMSIWGGDGAPDIGGKESPTILLVNSRHPPQTATAAPET